MNNNRKVLFKIIILLQATALSSCGGGGGGNEEDINGGTTPDSTTTTFPGGTLDDLMALSADLTFDHLEISGKLVLPTPSSETITVNSLTIKDTGSIGYTYSTCEYVSAPDITIQATGDVDIEGDIDLHGRSGTRVTGGAACNSCYGQNGGNAIISAANITVSANISTYGGSGSTFVFSGSPSSGCSGGNSGALQLTAKSDMDLSGANINANRGAGGYGGGSSGSNGASAAVSIVTDGQFSMVGGSVKSSGALTFEAGQVTDIYGPITYGSLTESIGGFTDTTQPSVTIVSPQPNSSIPWNQPLIVTIDAFDSGMGLREIEITGLGYDDTHSGTEFTNGRLTFNISTPNLPTTFDIVATDNKGLQTTTSVIGLSLAYTQEIEPNDDMTQAQAVALPDIIEGNINSNDSGSTNAAIDAFVNTSVTVQDWYSITVDTSGLINVALDFSDSQAVDLDLYLLDNSGQTLIGQSINDNVKTGVYSESIFKSGLSAGTYYLGVQAYTAPSNVTYKLKRN